MAEQTTWVKIDRNILNWRWYQDTNTKVVFLHLLLTANIKDHDFRGDTIHRGEVATSIGNIADPLKLTYDQVRTALNHLKDTKEITTKARPKYLVISITNYDKYQARPTEIPSKSQARPKQIPSTSQQSKNIKKEKKEKNLIRAANADAILEDYDGIFLSNRQWNEIEAVIGPTAMIEYVDKVAEWLEENPRSPKTHINVLKKFLRNDGLIK